MSRTALVVDDSMLIRHTVCRFLEERGYRVESATNGADALQILQGYHPDILITDMMMPKMDGTQLITELKKNPVLARVPVIVLAGKQSGAAAGDAGGCHDLEGHRYREPTRVGAETDARSGRLILTLFIRSKPDENRKTSHKTRSCKLVN
jgi:CheY-like chemotaxis protein